MQKNSNSVIHSGVSRSEGLVVCFYQSLSYKVQACCAPLALPFTRTTRPSFKEAGGLLYSGEFCGTRILSAHCGKGYGVHTGDTAWWYFKVARHTWACGGKAHICCEAMRGSTSLPSAEVGYVCAATELHRRLPRLWTGGHRWDRELGQNSSGHSTATRRRSLVFTHSIHTESANQAQLEPTRICRFTHKHTLNRTYNMYSSADSMQENHVIGSKLPKWLTMIGREG